MYLHFYFIAKNDPFFIKHSFYYRNTDAFIMWITTSDEYLQGRVYLHKMSAESKNFKHFATCRKYFLKIV